MIKHLIIYEDSSHDPQTKDVVFPYVSLENKFKKGWNQIALLYTIVCLLNTDLIKLYTIQKIADDVCGGQNKNRTIIGIPSIYLRILHRLSKK